MSYDTKDATQSILIPDTDNPFTSGQYQDPVTKFHSTRTFSSTSIVYQQWPHPPSSSKWTIFRLLPRMRLKSICEQFWSTFVSHKGVLFGIRCFEIRTKFNDPKILCYWRIQILKAIDTYQFVYFESKVSMKAIFKACLFLLFIQHISANYKNIYYNYNILSNGSIILSIVFLFISLLNLWDFDKDNIIMLWIRDFQFACGKSNLPFFLYSI